MIKNPRVLICSILSDLASGASNHDIIENYPSLTDADIRAALDVGIPAAW